MTVMMMLNLFCGGRCSGGRESNRLYIDTLSIVCHCCTTIEYIRDTVLFIARPRLASIGFGLYFSVGLPTPVNPTISELVRNYRFTQVHRSP